jgi:hypothetical protein
VNRIKLPRSGDGDEASGVVTDRCQCGAPTYVNHAGPTRPDHSTADHPQKALLKYDAFDTDTDVNKSVRVRQGPPSAGSAMLEKLIGQFSYGKAAQSNATK